MKKWILIMLVISTLFPTSAFAEEVMQESRIMLEARTGTVLMEQAADVQRQPASMTKMMTMLLIIEAIENHSLDWEDSVTISENAASMGGSQIFLEAGEQMTVKDLMKGIAIASGNDATVAMAEKLAGSEEAFVTMMNERAKELGAVSTVFKNTNGLPEEGHVSTARDMAIIGQELVKHEEILDFTSTYEDYLRTETDKPFWLVNTNKLIRTYPGVDGLKTGFTREAKYGITVSALRDNMRLITVVMGAESAKERNKQIASMLDTGFDTYTVEPYLEAAEHVSDMYISRGAKQVIAATAQDSLAEVRKKSEEFEEATAVVELDQVSAPIAKGQTIGLMQLKRGEEVIASTPLISNEEVEEASFWQFFTRSFSMLTKGNVETSKQTTSFDE
ncbi:D-alanyl-D-alanine carboxypeptidase [Paenalkalicoccus suaedae]|uniref:serine-type D-Ala-D-Ala carboxypeptidase n=1 Tax=Paenalkalicoccus suaedae TaxID=2592382 RepID=A0A859FDV8_9BACI|nr:D-alanyl-D-alanine carboxypeptidase family protein [Paenalkalicoccus suaedae]QKS71028.1 D-alanyl-D-alanine carboxypeptidase [Paenalkalicoccus suaedae]